MQREWWFLNSYHLSLSPSFICTSLAPKNPSSNTNIIWDHKRTARFLWLHQHFYCIRYGPRRDDGVIIKINFLIYLASHTIIPTGINAKKHAMTKENAVNYSFLRRHDLTRTTPGKSFRHSSFGCGLEELVTHLLAVFRYHNKQIILVKR